MQISKLKLKSVILEKSIKLNLNIFLLIFKFDLKTSLKPKDENPVKIMATLIILKK
jgi:hypothetical protein